MTLFEISSQLYYSIHIGHHLLKLREANIEFLDELDTSKAKKISKKSFDTNLQKVQFFFNRLTSSFTYKCFSMVKCKAKNDIWT